MLVPTLWLDDVDALWLINPTLPDGWFEFAAVKPPNIDGAFDAALPNAAFCVEFDAGFTWANKLVFSDFCENPDENKLWFVAVFSVDFPKIDVFSAGLPKMQLFGAGFPKIAPFSTGFPKAELPVDLNAPPSDTSIIGCVCFSPEFVALLPNELVWDDDSPKPPNKLFVDGAWLCGTLKKPLDDDDDCVEGVNLLDPKIDDELDEFDVLLSEVGIVFGERRDFGLDFGGANGILNTLSSSLLVNGVALLSRASILASGL